MTASGQDQRIWSIESYRGVGPIVLGSSLDEIEAVLGVRSVPVDKGDPLPTAIFAELGIHAHFAADATCEAVELMSPAVPVLDGEQLLGAAYPQIRAWLGERDPDIETDGAGATSELLGIGLYAPLAHAYPDRPAEGVIVFVRDYYQS